MHDEFMPRERGLLAGRWWAEARARTHEDVPQLAQTGAVPDDVRQWVQGMFQERLDAYAIHDPDAVDAFWDGFVHGVRAFVVEIHTGTSTN